MRMSTKGRYGLRIMIELAVQYGRGPVLVSAMAERQGISGKYIPVLMGRLKAAGLVRGVRGSGGGYELNRDPATLTALEVVEAMEGELVLVDCLEDPQCCPRVDACTARDLWCEASAALRGALARHTLLDLARRQQVKAVGTEGWAI